jgi:hypothetical protein
MALDFEPIDLFDFEALARNRLPEPESDPIAGGATGAISARFKVSKL